MTCSGLLELLAHYAAILTAAVAAGGYGLYRWERRQKQRRLENYLKAEKEDPERKSQRTLVGLSAELGMTETEIVDVAFRSSCIKRLVSPDSKGHASKVLLEYASKSN